MSQKRTRLLILNLAMDENHSMLSHQVEVVERLMPHFENVGVVTHTKGKLNSVLEKSVSIHIITTFRIYNIFKLVKSLLFAVKILRSEKPDVIFSHMATKLSLLIWPIAKLLNVRQVLWYAHASNSIFLRLVNLLGITLVSSTVESIPVSFRNSVLIGQGIPEELFLFRRSQENKLNKCVHVGRLDSSKKIEEIMDAVAQARASHPGLTLTFIGTPSNSHNFDYLESLKLKWRWAISEGWIIFTGPMERKELADHIRKYDIFIHAYQGSLDKALIEASMAGLLVVTTNESYCREFGLNKYFTGHTLSDRLMLSLSWDLDTRITF